MYKHNNHEYQKRKRKKKKKIISKKRRKAYDCRNLFLQFYLSLFIFLFAFNQLSSLWSIWWVKNNLSCLDSRPLEFFNPDR